MVVLVFEIDQLFGMVGYGDEPSVGFGEEGAITPRNRLLIFGQIE